MKIKERKIPGSGEIAENMEDEGGGNTSLSWCAWKGYQTPGKDTEGTEDPRKNQDHPDHSVI